MNAVLSRALQALSAQPGGTGNTIVDGCAPDPTYEYACINHRYYRRLCQYQPDCTRTCDDWVDISGC